jgi:NAD(P)-dependent dehydrogenase (short-subunit alcohol dehydrogenase family)
VQGLKGRSYIVTGAASGIGWATATRLLTEGALVMGADINEPLHTPTGNRASDGTWAFTRTDVTDEASVEQLVRAAVAFGGDLAGLVTRPAWPAAGPCTPWPRRTGTGSSPSI